MHYQPLCINGKHKCKKICASANCAIPNAFVCETCKNHHKEDCFIIDYSQVVTRLHKIQGLNKKDTYKYEDFVQNTFKMLIKSLQKQFVNFRDMFEHLNASESIKNFYEQIKRHKESAITGRKVISLMQQQFPLRNDFKLKSQALLWSLSAEIVELQKQVNSKLPYFYSVHYQVDKQHSLQVIDQKHQPLKQIETRFRRYREHIIGGLLESCIDKVQKLLQRDIYNIQRLYRATQHKFSVKAFHQICDGKDNTLTIVKTQFGNLAGGFCAIPWRSPNDWQYQMDDFEQTFIFGMSKKLCKLKCRPFKKKFMIGMHREYGPCFGDDLVIYNCADVSKGCWSNFPDCYQCKENPIPHTKQTIKDFVGVDDHYRKFNLLEWEVYKISFAQDEEQEASFLKEYRKL